MQPESLNSYYKEFTKNCEQQSWDITDKSIKWKFLLAASENPIFGEQLMLLNNENDNLTLPLLIEKYNRENNQSPEINETDLVQNGRITLIFDGYKRKLQSHLRQVKAEFIKNEMFKLKIKELKNCQN